MCFPRCHGKSQIYWILVVLAGSRHGFRLFRACRAMDPGKIIAPLPCVPVPGRASANPDPHQQGPIWMSCFLGAFSVRAALCCSVLSVFCAFVLSCFRSFNRFVLSIDSCFRALCCLCFVPFCCFAFLLSCVLFSVFYVLCSVLSCFRAFDRFVLSIDSCFRALCCLCFVLFCCAAFLLSCVLSCVLAFCARGFVFSNSKSAVGLYRH